MKILYYIILLGVTIVTFVAGVSVVTDINTNGFTLVNISVGLIISVAYIICRWGLDHMKTITELEVKGE